jgi:hypothetical protein
LRDSRVRRRVRRGRPPREQVRGGAPTTFVGCAWPALEPDATSAPLAHGAPATGTARRPCGTFGRV